MIILSPILPVNIVDRFQAIIVRGAPTDLQGSAFEPLRLSNSLNNIQKCDNKNRKIRGVEGGEQTQKPMNGTMA